MAITVKFVRQPLRNRDLPPKKRPRVCEMPDPPAGADIGPRKPLRLDPCLNPRPRDEQQGDLLLAARVPRQGKSMFQQRMHVNNVARIGQLIELQEQTLAFKAQTLAIQQQAASQLQIATATGAIAQSQKPRPDLSGIELSINDLKYSLIAEVSAVAAHLLDKRAVDAHTFLHDKLWGNTAGMIETTRVLLDRDGLQAAADAFASAVDPQAFEQFCKDQDFDKDTVYAEINRRAGYLVATQFLIATADIGDDDPGDWPDRPDRDETDVDPGIAVVAPQVPAAAQVAPPRIAGKRAKKIATPRSKR